MHTARAQRVAYDSLQDGERSMRITFDNNAHPNTERVTTAYSNTRTQESVKTGAYTADISGTVMDNNAYGVQGRTTEEVMQEALVTDVTTQQNYMTVMSHSMSTEDFSKMMEEGVNPNDMEIETVVTIVDRIKAELVKSGVSVAGYTDDLDSETLTEIVGSEGLARHLRGTFVQNDIPVTQYKVESVMDALNEAKQLTPPTEGELKYLVNNGMEPTIENLYMAEHSGAVDANRQGKGYYQENYGYYAKKADSPDFDKLLPQIQKIVTEAGLAVSEEVIKQAEWMVEKGIPLTAEKISCLHENSQLSFPLQEKEVVQAIAGAMAEGKRPMQANLTETENKYRKAAELSVNITAKIAEWLEDSSISISARRQLEEARLRMSAEVNVRLVESGFSIDTTDMETFVEALKEAETKQALRMFPKEEPQKAVENLYLYQDSIAKTALLPQLPAATIGKLLFEEKITLNVDNLVEKGEKLRTDYQKAGQAYETLMTAPRKDMGDTIRKAFVNVDDILKDLGIELTAENQRAVRILSYNRMAITPENLLQVREADRKVQRVIDKMTPASTLKMIRDGINPLTTDMADLEQYFKDQAENPEQEMETYSRYLYRLEKNQEISPQERDAYIGVYRMLRQIEKSDGAVIGSVLQARSELNFKQLLTAVRTAKKAGMNILVDETFGGLSDLHTEGSSIDAQINKINEEWINEIQEDILEDIRSLKNVESDVIKTLNQLDMPVTVNHMISASVLTQSANPLFNYIKKQLSDSSKEDDKKENEVVDTENAIFESITGTLTESIIGKEEMQKAYREFGTQVTELLQQNLYTPGQTSLDVKAMKSACMQLSVAMKMSQEETYEIPAFLQDGLTAIRLTIRHQSEENGQASISLETENYGKVQAFLQIRQGEVTGYVTGKSEISERLDNLKQMFPTAFEEKNLNLRDFRVVAAESKVAFTKSEEGVEKTTARMVYEAAKVVIKALREVL